jgi:uncharacterized protein HemX
MKIVQQPPPQPSRTAQTIAQLEAEIQQNQYQIGQLRQRNLQLRAHLNTLTQNRPPRSRPKPSSRRSTATATKSRQRKTKKRQDPSGFKIFFIALVIAIICGFLGFAIASMMTGR